jgi:hypothetical protein
MKKFGNNINTTGEMTKSFYTWKEQLLTAEAITGRNAQQHRGEDGSRTVRNVAKAGLNDRTPYRVVLTCPPKNLFKLLRSSWEMLTLRKTQKGRRTSKAAKKVPNTYRSTVQKEWMWKVLNTYFSGNGHTKFL